MSCADCKELRRDLTTLKNFIAKNFDAIFVRFDNQDKKLALLAGEKFHQPTSKKNTANDNSASKIAEILANAKTEIAQNANQPETIIVPPKSRSISKKRNRQKNAINPKKRPSSIVNNLRHTDIRKPKRTRRSVGRYTPDDTDKNVANANVNNPPQKQNFQTDKKRHENSPQKQTFQNDKKSENSPLKRNFPDDNKCNENGTNSSNVFPTPQPSTSSSSYENDIDDCFEYDVTIKEEFLNDDDDSEDLIPLMALVEPQQQNFAFNVTRPCTTSTTEETNGSISSATMAIDAVLRQLPTAAAVRKRRSAGKTLRKRYGDFKPLADDDPRGKCMYCMKRYNCVFTLKRHVKIIHPTLPWLPVDETADTLQQATSSSPSVDLVQTSEPPAVVLPPITLLLKQE